MGSILSTAWEGIVAAHEFCMKWLRKLWLFFKECVIAMLTAVKAIFMKYEDSHENDDNHDNAKCNDMEIGDVDVAQMELEVKELYLETNGSVVRRRTGTEFEETETCTADLEVSEGEDSDEDRGKFQMLKDYIKEQTKAFGKNLAAFVKKNHLENEIISFSAKIF